MEKAIKQLTLTCLLVFINCSFAQNSNSEQLLTSIIKTLQEQHQIQFNYAEDIVDGIAIAFPSKDLTLSEALAFLESKTSLSFTVISENIISIQPKNRMILCGYVKDIETAQPIESVTVQTNTKSAITDKNGFFQIEIKNLNELIELRHISYKTIVRSYTQFKTTSCEDILLFPNFQSLSEIVISNYITSGINKINNGGFEIDFSDFEILPGLIDNDVLHSVQSFPGIQSVNETVSNINIRGGTHDQNLILWDDIKMYQSGHFFGLISMYNPQITQKVFLKKNGTDASYTDGVSGTIMMQTEKNVNDTFNAVVGANLTDANGFVDVPISDKSSLQIAARKSISDVVETPTYTAFFNRIAQNTELSDNNTTITNSNQAFDFYDTSLRWIYNMSTKDELQLNFINVHNQLQFDENAIINNQAISRESNLTQNSIAGSIKYNRIWSQKFQTVLDIYETDYKLKAVNANILDSQRFLQENKVSETSVKLKTNYKLSSNIQLLNGYHFVETEVTNLDDVDNPLFKLLVSEVVRTHGVFSQLNYKTLNNNTYINIGLRYNYIDKFKKSLFEPRLSFNQKFLDHFTFEVLGEFKHQNTSQVINFQNDFLGIEKRRWQLSNDDDIPVITSKQFSAGLSYNRHGWLINTEVYYKNIKGITSQSQGFQNQYEFVKSIGSYEVKGVDVLLKKQINTFNAWLSYAYMNNLYLFESLEPETFPSNYNITHWATLGLTYSIKNFKLSTGLNWHIGKPITIPITDNEIVNNEVNFGPTNTSNLKDYLRLDVSAIYDFNLGKKAKGNLGVSFWNVLNKENEINSFYRVNNETLNEIIQRSLGFTPNAVLRVYFN
ncbi:MAG: TonB-dependent receptor [Flavobacteriaceae bacterium]